MKDSISRTKEWLENIIIDLSLCPFASKVYFDNSILYQPTHFSSIESCTDVLQSAISEILNLDSQFTTCLIIFETGLETFENYLDVYYSFEDSITNSPLKNEIQLASFHPDYQFEGTQKTDLQNYTNRSPYPIIHLLRVNDVTDAINSHIDIDSIPLRNIETMNGLGLERLRSLFKI